jgi:hypothetical protein
MERSRVVAEYSLMTAEHVEEKVIELIHRNPFVPFIVDLADGPSLEIPHPRLAINGGGAVFFGPDGGLIDFEFKSVRAIRILNSEAVA